MKQAMQIDLDGQTAKQIIPGSDQEQDSIIRIDLKSPELKAFRE
jgi:hypothetical protein